MREQALDRKNNPAQPDKAAQRWVWPVGTLAMAIAAAGLVLLFLNRATPIPPRWGFRGFQILYGVPITIIGVLIARGRPQNPIGWLLLVSGFFAALTGFSEEYAVFTLLTQPGRFGNGALVAGLGHWLWLLSYGMLAIFVPLLFPDGRFLDRRWWVVAWMGVMWIALGAFVHLFLPGPLGSLRFIDNPFGIANLKSSLAWTISPYMLVLAAGVVLMVAAAFSLIVRYRQSSEEVRQQLKWFAYAAVFTPMAGVVGQFDGLIFDLLLFLSVVPVPIALGVAILRHRLYDIDILINRTLVYGALTALVVGLYALLVGSASMVLQNSSNLAALFLTGILTVVLFRPVHSMIQGGVDRMTDRRSVPPPQDIPDEITRVETPEITGTWLLAARVSWALIFLVSLGILIASLPAYALHFNGFLVHGTPATGQASARFFAIASGVTSLASALLSLSLAWLLFRRRFAEPAAIALSFFLLAYGIVMAGPMEKATFYWFENNQYGVFLQSILTGTPMVALLVLFPNGRFVPRWTRGVLLSTLPWNLVMVFILWKYPGFIMTELWLFVALAVWYFGTIVLSIYAQVYRYRNVSTLAERQQMKWIIYGFGLWFLLILLTTGPYFYLVSLPSGAPTPWWAPASELVWFLGLNILPVSFTIAIMRYRLWNIDLVINRTLVYGALTASVVVLYVLVIGGLGLIFQSTDSLLIPLLATGLAAVLFQPFRDRLQGGVNRMMYGERDDPGAVLARLSEQLEQTGSPEAALSGIVTTVAQALKLPYVAVELGDPGQIAASYGLPVDNPQRFALIYQGETIGQLLAGERALRESFTPKDLELLANVARQAGAAGHAALLTADLRRSRQRLVTAQEEERRRLRRDLHDGLGPTLASLTLKMDATRNVLRRDPEQAEKLLSDLKKQTQETIQEIRTLVYGLRPPALDEFGLIGAIQSFIDGQSPNRPHITLEVSPGFPALPAAYEVAVYRIVMEGLTNVLRHADAAAASIRITHRAGEILVEVVDDGVGVQAGTASGVGMASMQERAEELGGTLTFLRRARGSHLQARLPLGGAE